MALPGHLLLGVGAFVVSAPVWTVGALGWGPMSSDIVQDDSEIDAGARPPAASGAWRRRPSWATLTFAFGIAAAVNCDVVQARRLWFFGDDWEFMLHRGLTGHPDYGLFYPHNEHWSTLPILVFRSLYAVFGARRYMPYARSALPWARSSGPSTGTPRATG